MAAELTADLSESVGRALGWAVSDLRPAWPAVALLLVSATRRNFAGQHGPDGVPWVPFQRTPSRKRGGRSAKLLRDTGILMASYTAGGSGHVEQAAPLALTWGSNVDRAGWHHFGTRTIPAREQVGFSEQLLRDVEEVVLDYLERAFAAAP